MSETLFTRFDVFHILVHEGELLPLLKLLLQEFNLTEANFVNVRTDIATAAKR